MDQALAVFRIEFSADFQVVELRLTQSDRTSVVAVDLVKNFIKQRIPENQSVFMPSGYNFCVCLRYIR